MTSPTKLAAAAPVMTISQAKYRLAIFPMNLTKTADGEFRVNFPSGREATAYYTTDLQDAVATGIAMYRGKVS